MIRQRHNVVGFHRNLAPRRAGSRTGLGGRRAANPRSPSWMAKPGMLTYSPRRKELGTDGNGRRRHLQTWMAQLNPNCIRATRGAGQDLTSESSGKGSRPEPGWTREQAKALRAATLQEQSDPTAPLSAFTAGEEEGQGCPTDGSRRSVARRPAAGYREPHARRPGRRAAPSPASPPKAPLPRSKSQRRGTVETRSAPLSEAQWGTEGAVREVSSRHFVLSSLNRRRSKLL